MKKKISLKKLDLKVNKINDLQTKKITGGGCTGMHQSFGFCDFTIIGCPSPISFNS